MGGQHRTLGCWGREVTLLFLSLMEGRCRAGLEGPRAPSGGVVIQARGTSTGGGAGPPSFKTLRMLCNSSLLFWHWIETGWDLSFTVTIFGCSFVRKLLLWFLMGRCGLKNLEILRFGLTFIKRPKPLEYKLLLCFGFAV